MYPKTFVFLKRIKKFFADVRDAWAAWKRIVMWKRPLRSTVWFVVLLFSCYELSFFQFMGGALLMILYTTSRAQNSAQEAGVRGGGENEVGAQNPPPPPRPIASQCTDTAETHQPATCWSEYNFYAAKSIRF